MNKAQNQTKYNKNLAGYFSGKPLYLDGLDHKKPHVRKLMELPWQMTEAAMWDEVTETLCNLDFIQAKAAAKLTYELVDDFNMVLEVIPDNAENVKQERQRQARMEKYTQDLIKCAKGEIKAEDLDIPQSITPWTEEEIDREVQRIKINPTRADKLRDFVNFLGQEVANLQMFAADIPNFAYQQAWNYYSGGVVGKMAESIYLLDTSMLLLKPIASRPDYNPIPHIMKTYQGHESDVNAISITADGKCAISGSRDNTCILWELENGRVLHSLKGHTSDVYSVSITPDGTKAVSGSCDKTCILWDLLSGRAIHTLWGHTDRVMAVRIFPDGKRAISCSKDCTCILWNLDIGKAVHVFRGYERGVSSFCITPDGIRAISNSHDKSCIVWDLENRKKVRSLVGHKESVWSVDVTPDGKRAISGSYDNTCILWDVDRGVIVFTLVGHCAPIKSVSISPDGKRAISCSLDKTCIFWDLTLGKIISIIRGHTYYVRSVCMTPDGTKAISGSCDKTCILWNLHRGKETRILNGHTEMVTSLSINPNLKNALSNSKDNSCIVWNLCSGETYRIIKDYNVLHSARICPDGKRALTFSNYTNSNLFDLESCNVIRTLKGYPRGVRASSITPDGKRALSVSYDNTLILWDLESGSIIHSINWNTDDVNSISIAPDGKRAISGSGDNTCILWDLESLKIIHILEGHTHPVRSINISADGKKAMSGSHKTIILWDLVVGKIVTRLQRHTDIVCSVNFSPDGRIAISGSYDNTCVFWDLERVNSVLQFPTGSSITDLVASTDRVIIGHYSGEVSIMMSDRRLLCPGIPNVTAREIWDFDQHSYLPLSVDCPFCGHRFPPDKAVVDTINRITEMAALSPEQSPCLDLPEEVWEYPGLLSRCPNCNEELKFNPFFPAHLNNE